MQERFEEIVWAYNELTKKGDVKLPEFNLNVNVNLNIINVFGDVLELMGFDTGNYEIEYVCPICGKRWKERSPIRVDQVIEEICFDCLTRLKNI